MSAPFSYKDNPLSKYTNLNHYIPFDANDYSCRYIPDNDKYLKYRNQSGLRNKTYYLKRLRVLRRMNRNGKLIMKPFIAMGGFRVRCAACTESLPQANDNLKQAFTGPKDICLRTLLIENQAAHLEKAEKGEMERLIVPKRFYFDLNSGEQLYCVPGVSLEFQEGLEVRCKNCNKDEYSSQKNNGGKEGYKGNYFNILKRLAILAISIYLSNVVLKNNKNKNIIIFIITILLWEFLK